MSRVTTPAVLLRSHPYSETSRVLRLLTRDLGLVGVMAKGVRRRASQGEGAVGTYAEGAAVIAHREGRDLQTLVEFTPTDLRMGLATDFRRLSGASVAAELILRHGGEEPNPRLYRALTDGLARLARSSPDDIAGEVLALCWRMVEVLGFGPELHSCTACGGRLGERDMARFDIAGGGVVGPECRHPPGSRRVGPLARGHLDLLLRGDVPGGLRGVRAHLSLLQDFTAHHLLGGRPLSSLRFVAPSA